MGCPSGQRDLTVNQAAEAYEGSNPSPTTVRSRYGLLNCANAPQQGLLYVPSVTLTRLPERCYVAFRSSFWGRIVEYRFNVATAIIMALLQVLVFALAPFVTYVATRRRARGFLARPALRPPCRVAVRLDQRTAR